MHAVKPLAFSAPAEGSRNPCYEIPFGGSYRESWTEGYSLTIHYQDRRSVLAVWNGEQWRAEAGDPQLTAQLKAADCPAVTTWYFQAAAETRAAVDRCAACGLHPEQLWECAHFDGNPLAAPELMRMLMDDCGLSLDSAYQVVSECCEDLNATGVDVEQLYPLQPRTAHVISILRGCGHHLLTAEHDARDPAFRSPSGAIQEGNELRMGLRILSGRAERAFKGDGIQAAGLPACKQEQGHCKGRVF